MSRSKWLFLWSKKKNWFIFQTEPSVACLYTKSKLRKYDPVITIISVYFMFEFVGMFPFFLSKTSKKKERNKKCCFWSLLSQFLWKSDRKSFFCISCKFWGQRPLVLKMYKDHHLSLWCATSALQIVEFPHFQSLFQEWIISNPTWKQKVFFFHKEMVLFSGFRQPSF